MKKRMMVCFGIRRLMSEKHQDQARAFLCQLQLLFENDFEIEECVPIELANGRYIWSANSCLPADVLIVALFDRPARSIEFKIRQQEGLTAVPILVLGAFYHDAPTPDYTNVCIDMNSGGAYKFHEWVFASPDDGLVKVNEFLKANKLPHGT